MSKISTTDVEKLFISLVTAANKNTKEGKQEFIEIMKKKRDEFNKPIDSRFTNGNTINHSIARAISGCPSGDCSLCTKKDAQFGTYPLVTKYGEAPYIVFKYINDNDDVKEEYKNLFSATYPKTKNNNEYTPIYFAELCNPEFAQYMTPVKSPRSSSFKEAVKNVAYRSKKEFSNLVARAASSNSKKETNQKKPPSAKDKDLTLEELREKKAALEKQLPGITHTIITYGNTNSPGYVEQKKKDEEEAKKIAEIEKDIAILNKEIDKKTKKPSFFSRVRAFVKKGGKTRKHKKTNKRRTYRRK